jgi:DNA-binding response OmpR family regulator
MDHYPTILVARDDGLDYRVVQSLQRDGFHVLEADDWDQLFDVVKVHSRRIHLLLLDAKNMYANVPILKAHRSWLQVLFIEKPVDVDDVLARVRKLIGSPPSPSSIR